MKAQTAVEFINSELERQSNQIGVNLSWSIVDDLIKQAKEIEKNQIIDTFWVGCDAEAGDNKYMTGEDYYNKTYK